VKLLEHVDDFCQLLQTLVYSFSVKFTRIVFVKSDVVACVHDEI